MNLATIQALYPKVKNNQAVTGTIPIEDYYRNEEEISEVIRAERLHRFYRGPRATNRFRTLKADATGVVLYRKY